MNEVVNEIKNGTCDVSCVDPNGVAPPIDVIWTTTDGIQIAQFNETCLPEIGGCQVSSILSTIEERSRDADFVLNAQEDNLPNTNPDQLVKSIAFNVCSTESLMTNVNNCQQNLSNVNNRCQRNVILPSGQKQLYEEMVFFGCNLCPFICTKDSKISDHIDSVHRNPEHSYNRLKLKCPGCSNVFHHKLSLRSHLIYDHEVGKSDINKIVNGIVYVSLMMNNENMSRLKENGENADANEESSENIIEHAKKQEIDFLQESENQCEDSEEEILNEAQHEINNIAPMENIEPNIENCPQIREDENISCEMEPKTILLQETPVKNDEICPKDDISVVKIGTIENNILKCGIPTCTIRLRRPSSVAYHVKCHKQNESIDQTAADQSKTTASSQSNNFFCPECNWTTSNWRTLQTHLWQEHKIDVDMFACYKCEYRTNSLSTLNNVHRLIHGDAKPYLCDDCGKGFKNQKQLRNHKLIHSRSSSSRSSHVCTKCQRVFPDRRQLRVHVSSVHDKIKPFNCTECGYKTSSKGALRLHSRKHTGERPYKCENCEYATSDHNSLRRHRLRHSGIKKYSCPHCSYACIQSSTYKTHMKTKHPGQEEGAVHTCTQCQFRTLSMQKYIIHMASHGQENQTETQVNEHRQDTLAKL